MLELDQAAQWDQGMYMIGQVASMHHEVTTLAELHADISAGSGELLADLPAPGEAEPALPDAPPPADVAIIGMGCILPGAPDVETLWANILGKVDAVGEVPAERWDTELMFDPDRDHAGPRLLALGRLHRAGHVQPDGARASRRRRWPRSSRSSCSR